MRPSRSAAGMSGFCSPVESSYSGSSQLRVNVSTAPMYLGGPSFATSVFQRASCSAVNRIARVILCSVIGSIFSIASVGRW
jgi:hypothetical protein